MVHNCSCGKTFQRLNAFKRHRGICEILREKTHIQKKELEETSDIPTIGEMWLIIKTLVEENDKLKKELKKIKANVGIQNKRIKASIRNHKFKDRIFSSKELKLSSYSKNKIGFFSKRFAAKEAFAKALGTGFRNNLNFKDIEIMNDKLGKPYYAKTKKITKIIRKEFRVKNFNCFLSISDEKEYSIAFAIIETV